MVLHNTSKTVLKLVCSLAIVVLAVTPSCNRKAASVEYADPPPPVFLPKVDPGVSWDDIAFSSKPIGERGSVGSITYRTSDLDTREKQIAFMTRLKDAAIKEVARRNTSDVLKKAELSISEEGDEVRLTLEAGSHQGITRFTGHAEPGGGYIIIHENKGVGPSYE